MPSPTRIGVSKTYDIQHLGVTGIALVNKDMYNVLKTVVTDAGWIVTSSGTASAPTFLCTTPWEAPIVGDTPVYKAVYNATSGVDKFGLHVNTSYIGPFISSTIESHGFSSLESITYTVVADAVLGVIWVSTTLNNPVKNGSTVPKVLGKLIYCTRSARVPDDQTLPSATVPRFGVVSTDTNMLNISTTPDMALGSRLVYNWNSYNSHAPSGLVAGIASKLSAPISGNSRYCAYIYGDLVGIRHVVAGGFSGFTYNEVVIVKGDSYIMQTTHAPEAIRMAINGSLDYEPLSAFLGIVPAAGLTDLGMYIPV